MEDAAPDVVVT